MRFKQFIAEDDSPEEWLQLLETECAPYIRELPHPLHPDLMLFRGMTLSDQADVLELTVNKNRPSKDTDPQLHAVADDWFFDNFGWRARSQGLFCTGHKNQAQVYGKGIYAIFPMGAKYEYIWSPKVDDLYRLSTTCTTLAKNALGRGTSQDEIMDHAADILIDHLEGSSYQDENLEAAIMSHNEIMVKCDSYVAIKYRSDFWNKHFLDWLVTTDL